MQPFCIASVKIDVGNKFSTFSSPRYKWWLKMNFSCQSCNNQKISPVATRLVTKKSEGGHLICHMLKAFQKHMTCPLFLAIKKNRLPLDNGGVLNHNKKKLVTIWHTLPQLNGDWNFLVTQEGMVGMSFFSKMILHAPPPFLAIENFQSPSNIPPPSYGNWKGWGLCYHFGGKQFFPHFPSWTIENFWSPFNDVGVSNGAWNSSIAIWRWG